MKSLGLIGITVTLVVFGNVRATARQGATVPKSLLAAVESPLAEFSRLVAKVIPAGFELHESDDAWPRSVSEMREGQPTIPVGELIAAFNRANRSYRAEMLDNVFVVRPIDGRSMFLDSPSPISEPIKEVGVIRSLRIVLSPLNADLLKPSAGSVMGKRAVEAFSTPIALDGSKPRRVINTLNQIAAQAPGAWQVITRRRADKVDEIIRFAFIYSDGARSVTPMPGFGQTQR